MVYEWSLLAIFNLSSMVCKGVLLRGALPRVLMVGLPLLSNVPWGSRFKSIICKDQKKRSFINYVDRQGKGGGEEGEGEVL